MSLGRSGGGGSSSFVRNSACAHWGLCLRLDLLLFGDSDVVLGVLLDEGNEALEGAVTFVVNKIATTSGLELESGETGYPEGNGGGKVILRGLELGNDDLVLDGGEVLSELQPCGCETLAVTTP